MLEVNGIANYLLEAYSSFLHIDQTGPDELFDSKQSEPSSVNLENCTTFLDRRLLALSWFELRDFYLVVHKLSQHILILRDLAAECKCNGQNLSAPQSVKVQKLCELLDSLPAISIFTPVAGDSNTTQISTDKVVSSFLPDHEYIQGYIFKVRSKLKTVEEMAASKKTEAVKFRFSGKLSLQSRLKDRKHFDLSVVRKELKDFHDDLDLLEHYLGQYENLFSYFASIKKYVHRYYQDVLLAAATLPSLEEHESRMQLENASFVSQEVGYNAARSNESLIAAASARKEMLVIEQESKSMIHSNLPIEHIVRCLRDIEENTDDEFSTLIVPSQLEILKGLICGAEHDLIGIFSEQHVSDIEAAFRALGSYIVHRFDYSWLDESFDSDTQDVFLESIISADKEEEDEEDVRDNDWIDQVHNFELDFFIGLIQRWKEKETVLEETIRSESFESAYSELQEQRLQYCSSAVSLEKVMDRYKDLLDQHLLVSREVAQFKDRFCKVVQSELNQSVEVEIGTE